MSYLIGFILIVLGAALVGFAIGRATVPLADRSQRDELKRARKALADLDEVIAGGSLELSMLGSNVGNQASDILRKYWRGDQK